MTPSELPHSEIWILDTEYTAHPGERPAPICLVAWELRSGKEVKLWLDDLRDSAEPPFAADSLLVCYFAPAEIGCFLALDWRANYEVLDLFVEFRCETNGNEVPGGNGLMGALIYYGLSALDSSAKERMRALALRGGPFTQDERNSLVEYCAGDVRAAAQILPRILAPMTHDDFQRALLRGRYMCAVAAIEHNGIPLDVELLEQLRINWDSIKMRLIAAVDVDFRVYVEGRFSQVRWSAWLRHRGIPWPTTQTGQLKLDDDTFKDIGRMHTDVETMRQLRHAQSQLRMNSLTVGIDGRNRALLSPFRSKTGRNQPSTSKFIFGPAVWTRSLIVARPGWGLAYADWCQQEFGIGAYLSHDPNMIEAYESHCPYLKFAELAGAVPPGATKTTHPKERATFKACALAVQYGMGPNSLAIRLQISPLGASLLLEKHRRIFKVYWAWADGALSHALQLNHLSTAFGWTLRTPVVVNPRSVQNFPLQANAAEMLRLACVFAVEAGLEVCAPVHDAILIHAPEESLPQHVAKLEEAMAEASRLVLGGATLKTDVKIRRYPERFTDERGTHMWQTVMRLLGRKLDE